MKKRVLSMLLAGVLLCANAMPVLAAEADKEEVTEEAAEEETKEAAEEESEEGAEEETEEAAEEGTEAVDEEETEAAETAIVIPQGNMVNVDEIDLSLHSETSGDFTSTYTYANPFLGEDTSQGVVLEFYAQPTWEVHELGAIFAFNGTGEYDGKLYFSPGSYLGFNSEGFGGFFDANLFNYTLVTDYIKDGAKIRIEILPDGFSVYADDQLCYDQTILDDPEASSGDFSSTSDFSGVLEWLAGAEVLYFGYGSWWNVVGSNEANMNLSQLSFRLEDGTVVMDQLAVDKDLVESLGGTLSGAGEESGEEAKVTPIDVEIFDIDSVAYEGSSVLPVMTAAVAVAAVIAAAVVLYAVKKRTYEDI